MNATPPLRRTLLAAALLLPACGAFEPPPSPGGPLAVLGEKRAAWEALERSARAAYEAGRWEESAERHREKFALFPTAAPDAPPDERVEAILRTDLYNVACCLALSGRKADALDALERALLNGVGSVGFDHLVQDPDLESLHGEARWGALVKSLTGGGGASEGPFPEAASSVVVELLPTRREMRTMVAESMPAEDRYWPSPPYWVSRDRASWTTRLDAGERAAAVVAFESNEKRHARRVLRASGPEMVGLAWEVLLRRPDAFTHAVLDGPAPPARVLLDRGADRLKTAILVADAKGVPDARVGVKVEVAGSAEEALRKALR